MTSAARGLVAFNVFVSWRGAEYRIDTIFYGDGDTTTENEVRDSLVNHDGYDPRIYVRRESDDRNVTELWLEGSKKMVDVMTGRLVR